MKQLFGIAPFSSGRIFPAIQGDLPMKSDYKRDCERDYDQDIADPERGDLRPSPPGGSALSGMSVRSGASGELWGKRRFGTIFRPGGGRV